MVLQSIRERLTGILAIFILGLLVIPFAFVGVNSYFQSGTENLVAMVNDREITFNEFNQSFLNYRRRMQSLMGEAFDPAQFDGPVARREHLERMIDETLLEQAARDLDLSVDDERLAEAIRDIPAFQVDGEFNPDVYQSRLLAQGLSASRFEQDMRTQMVMSQLPSGISRSSFATDTELQEFVALQEQTRDFRAVIVPLDLDAVDGEFGTEEIAAYYAENPGQFQTEERVLIGYLELSAEDIVVDTEVDDEFLRSRFEQQKARFVTPEQRLVSHVLIEVSPEADEATIATARQQAEDVARRARAGEDFAELAAEYSDDQGSAHLGGDLGWMEPGVMVETFEDAMYELTPESPISEPVRTGFGWHVIKLRDIREAEGQTFEEARPVLAEEYREEQAERVFLERADRLVDIIYEDPTTLESAALDLGLEVQTAGPFGRAGGEGIAANPGVVEAAFSDLVLLQGSVSDPIDIGPDHLVVIRLREHYPVSVRPLEDVQDEIVASLREQRAAENARARAEAVLADVQSGDSTLQERAAAEGLEVLDIRAAGRRHGEPDPQVVSAVFGLRRPAEDASVTAVVEAQDGFAVVALDAVTDGTLPDDSPLARRQYRRQLANANASSEAWALVRQLREQSEVRVFEENLGVSR